VTTGVITASLCAKTFETRFLFCQAQVELSFMVSGVARAILLDGNPYIRETRFLEDSMGGCADLRSEEDKLAWGEYTIQNFATTWRRDA